MKPVEISYGPASMLYSMFVDDCEQAGLSVTEFSISGYDAIPTVKTNDINKVSFASRIPVGYVKTGPDEYVVFPINKS